MATMSEKETISRAQREDASAFESLYNLHGSRVYSLCLRMVGNTAEAEDLTQETFLMVYRKIRTFRGDSAFSTWLHRIAVNLFLMGLRRKTSLETPLENPGEPGTYRPVTRGELAGSDFTLAGSLDRLNLERAMKKLRPSQRLVFVLHDIQGYKHAEIAKMLDWSTGNSKSLLHRARTQLRTLLQEGMYFGRIAPSRSAQPAFSA
jgi:RNA polymerase sigma-70 factor (ECF subfamily)